MNTSHIKACYNNCPMKCMKMVAMSIRGQCFMTGYMLVAMETNFFDPP